MDQGVPGLIVDDKRLTVRDQAERMADEFLYPEKYIEMGQSVAA